MWRCISIFIAAFCLAQVAVIDRISVIVGTRVVKASDIEREIRITSFLNGKQPDFKLASRKQAANRLIDQDLIRNEIQSGGYQVAPTSDADALLAQLRKSRFTNGAQYRQALNRYGIDEGELKHALLWQLTVLRFIDARFRPGVLVTDQDVQEYQNKHGTNLKREQVEDLISGERINKQFYDWLDQNRKDLRIEYREESLK